MTPIIYNYSPWREKILEGLFPRGCALCEKTFYDRNRKKTKEKNLDYFFGLCKDCRDALSIPLAKRGLCSLCGQPLVSEADICLPCRNRPGSSIDRIISLFPYTGKFQKILVRYKFGNRFSLGNFFTDKLWQGLNMLLSRPIAANNKENSCINFCWVPVPARPGKIKHKGWDQIEYLAALLEKDILYQKNNCKYAGKLISDPACSVSLLRCLKRLPSESQKKLGRESREQNLKKKIILNSSNVPKTAVLFDDVYTTGATMEACAAALKSGGTENVYGICLCYD